jgi:hypothetical protein
MASYYCTDNYEALQEAFFKRFTGENPYKGWDMDKAIEELSQFTRGYLKEKKRYDWWMSHQLIENPKNNKEAWYNAFWKCEHSENSLYAKSMNQQKSQFIAMENAIIKWLPLSGMTEKEQARVMKKVNTRKSKIFSL